MVRTTLKDDHSVDCRCIEDYKNEAIVMNESHL